jgi:hypothetical protein
MSRAHYQLKLKEDTRQENFVNFLPYFLSLPALNSFHYLGILIRIQPKSRSQYGSRLCHRFLSVFLNIGD